jgi:hypothetical protein
MRKLVSQLFISLDGVVCLPGGLGTGAATCCWRTGSPPAVPEPRGTARRPTRRSPSDLSLWMLIVTTPEAATRRCGGQVGGGEPEMQRGVWHIGF